MMTNRFFFCSALVACAALAIPAQAQSLQDNEHYSSFKSWAIHTQEPNPVPNMFKFCIQSYDKMIASGVSPSARVPEQTLPPFGPGDKPIVWAGTVQELKEKWCEAGLKKTTGDVAAKHAPYKAALKNDKLRLVIDETHGHVTRYALPGGQYTTMRRSSPRRRPGSSTSARPATSGRTARAAASANSCASTRSMPTTSSWVRLRRSSAAIRRRRRIASAYSPLQLDRHFKELDWR
jgi:hypothetical protein